MARDPHKAISLFEGLQKLEISAVIRESFTDRWTAPAGDLETGNTLYLIEEGIVEITLPLGQGSRNVPVLITLGPGDFFGETRLLFPEPLARPRIASADGAIGRVLRLPSPDDVTDPLEQLIAAHPKIGVNLVAEIGRRLLAASRFVPSHAAPLRLGYFLLGATSREHTIDIPNTAALAAQLGLSVPAVAHALTTLEGAHLVTVTRSESVEVDVPSRPELANYLGVAHPPSDETEPAAVPRNSV